MERLTTRNAYGGIVSAVGDTHAEVVANRILHKLAAYEDTGLDPATRCGTRGGGA